MQCISIDENIDSFISLIGIKSTVIIKRFYMGKVKPVKAAIIYINALVIKDIIDRDILSPLMLGIDEELKDADLPEYIAQRYVPVCSTEIISDINMVVEEIKRGKTAIIIDSYEKYIIADTSGGVFRGISEPENETAIRGSREGFVENIETNVSIIRRRIKGKSLVVELTKVGKRTQSDLAIIYVSGIADNSIVKQLKKKIDSIDVDAVPATGVLEQYLCKYTYNIFPQFGGTERPDKVVMNLLEGRVALILEGTPYVITVPSLFIEYFQTPEDYYQRPIVSSFIRLLRLLAAFFVLNIDAFYIALVSGNNEFIPLKFVIPIAQARQGVALSVFAGVTSMEIIVEFLREGGLRLPSKIGQTLSVVGGIIIGDAAVKSKIVSSSSLFVVGITTVASFLISNYDMALAVRFLRFPMMILTDLFGFFGLASGWFLILIYLCSLENFGVPYFSFKMNDMKDELVRAPFLKAKYRPDSVPNIDSKRMKSFSKKNRKDKNE